MTNKLPHAGAKKNRPQLIGRKDRQYQSIMSRAFRLLDADDYAGFWNSIDDLNAYMARMRDEVQ